MREQLTKALCSGIYHGAVAWGFTSAYVKTDPTVEACIGIARAGRSKGTTKALRKRIEQKRLADELSDPDIELEMEES